MAKDIMQQVGQGCPNLLPDIMTLQQLLNDVPDLFIERPGDCKFIPADGQITPLFQAALARFQQRSTEMKQEGNRLLPGGFTLSALNSWQTPKILTREGTFLCPHGGTVNVMTTGKPDARNITLSINATMVVSGCPFTLGLQPAACISARFLASATPNFVDTSTPSLCMGMIGPAGPIIIANPGTRFY